MAQHFESTSLAARVNLNILLNDSLSSVIQEYPHSEAFKSSVDIISVSGLQDYLSFVDSSFAFISLDLILARTKSCFYSEVSELKKDLEVILSNTIAYNSPDCGEKADPELIEWAQGLIHACDKAIESRMSDLLEAEGKLRCHLPQVEDKPEHSDQGEKCPNELSGLAALIAACELIGPQVIQGKMLQPAAMKAVDIPAIYTAPQLPAPMLMPNFQPAKSKVIKTSCDSNKHTRRHKSKVFIRPNKVVYLPTTFMEDNFDPLSLPVNCEMVVEVNGSEIPGSHQVTIKAVPRQGLSTMYCMTNVLKFQNNYLNWQIVNWTRVDSQRIKIHLLGPEGGDEDPSDRAHKIAHEQAKRKNSDSAYEENGRDPMDEDGGSNEQRHRSPKGGKLYEEPALRSQNLDLSPTNSDGTPPKLSSPTDFDITLPRADLASGLGLGLGLPSHFPNHFSTALFPPTFGSCPFPFPTQPAMGPSMAWMQLMNNNPFFGLSNGMNPLLMGAMNVENPLMTMRSSNLDLQAGVVNKKVRPSLPMD